MMRREKAVLAVMAGVVVYGAVDVVVTRSGRMTAEMLKSSAASPEVRAAVAAAREAAAEGAPGPAELAALRAAGKPWAASPLAKVPEPREAVVAEERPVRYTGFVKVGNDRLGILDGREYRPGERLASGEYIVVDVEPDTATLRSSSGNRIVKLPMEKTQ
jgi:hypothetical protein